MTSDLSYRPDYLARPGANVGNPPFLFQGVTMRVLPLRANLGRLNAFVDAYLNLEGIPEASLHFSVSTPHVFLSLLNYGRMSSKASDAGWVSQNELLFMIMLDRVRRVSGQLVHDQVTVCPFIFVDSAASQLVGQEVYGWPKVQFSIAPTTAPWSRSPIERTTLSHLRTLAYPIGGIGAWGVDRTMLEIELDSTSVAAQFPPDPVGRSGITGVVGRYAQNVASFWTNLFTQWVPVSGNVGGAGAGPWAQIPKLVELLSDPSALEDSAFFSSVNLKQFRDTVDQDAVCHQAIVSSRMRVLQVNRLGLLGDMHYLLGDPSGGCSVRLHDLPNLPVVEMFGLEVEAEETLPGDGEPTRTVSRLRPLFPFWCDVDLEYEAGEILCWRTKTSGWHMPGMPLSAATTGIGARPQINPYNTARGAAVQSLPLPFRLNNTSVHVLPLLADREKLTELLEPWNGAVENGALKLEPWGHYVYLIVTSTSQASSSSDELGTWPLKSARFAVPVKVLRRQASGGYNPESLALVSPFVFMADHLAAQSSRETLGWPSELAVFEGQTNTWLDDSPEDALDRLLCVSAEVLPAVGLGQKTERRALIEVTLGQSVSERSIDEWREIADGWGNLLKGEVRRKQNDTATDPGRKALQVLKALSLEVTAHGAPLTEISLKQFRDAEDPHKACYQALVASQHTIQTLWDLSEVERAAHVRIHHFPSHPVVDLLGLKVRDSKNTEQGRIDTLEPVRPFRLRADLEWGRGEILAEWDPGSAATARPLVVPPAHGSLYQFHVGCEMVAMLESGLEMDLEYVNKKDEDRQHREKLSKMKAPKWWTDEVEDELTLREYILRHRATRWARAWWRYVKANPHSSDPLYELLTLEDVRDAMTHLEPQFAVEAILSREWHQQGRRQRWHSRLAHPGLQGSRPSDRATPTPPVYLKPDFCARRDAVGMKQVVREFFETDPRTNDFRSGTDDDPSGWWSGSTSRRVRKTPPKRERPARSR